jgi:hypothetical protein
MATTSPCRTYVQSLRLYRSICNCLHMQDTQALNAVQTQLACFPFKHIGSDPWRRAQSRPGQHSLDESTSPDSTVTHGPHSNVLPMGDTSSPGATHMCGDARYDQHMRMSQRSSSHWHGVRSYAQIGEGCLRGFPVGFPSCPSEGVRGAHNGTGAAKLAARKFQRNFMKLPAQIGSIRLLINRSPKTSTGRLGRRWTFSTTFKSKRKVGYEDRGLQFEGPSSSFEDANLDVVNVSSVACNAISDEIPRNVVRTRLCMYMNPI